MDQRQGTDYLNRCIALGILCIPFHLSAFFLLSFFRLSFFLGGGGGERCERERLPRIDISIGGNSERGAEQRRPFESTKICPGLVRCDHRRTFESIHFIQSWRVQLEEDS